MLNGNVINDTQTATFVAGKAITSGPFTAVTVGKDGAETCTSATVPMGLTLVEADDPIAVGDDVSVLIKDCGVWKAGATFAAGDLLASDDNGCAVKATTGKFILAVALEAAAAEGQPVSVQIVKAGYSA
nr:MAG TPA: capsid fiber protein [Caudoviricetes sp.]